MYVQKAMLVLGSASPRRKSLLAEFGIEFECAAADIDESVRDGEHPRDLARRLALSKAEVIADRFASAFVLGADTDVEVDGVILGKPSDTQDAVKLLSIISGRTHTVWGGCALVQRARGISEAIVSETRVTMRPMSSRDIERYVATGEPMDKAGAYGVQGLGSQYISHIEGSYPNVVGLDTPRVIEMLRTCGVIEYDVEA